MGLKERNSLKIAFLAFTHSGARGQVHRQHARQRGAGPRAAAAPGRAPLRRLHRRRRGHPPPGRQHQDPPHAKHEPRRMEDQHRRGEFANSTHFSHLNTVVNTIKIPYTFSQNYFGQFWGRPLLLAKSLSRNLCTNGFFISEITN